MPLGATGTSSRKIACSTRHDSKRATCVERASVELAANMRWKQLNPTKGACLAGPQELVRLGAPEQIEFVGPFIDSAPNRECHQNEPNTVLPVAIVEPVLVEVEAPVVHEAVHHGSDGVIDAQCEQAKPAARERLACGFIVKCNQLWA